MYVDLEVDGEFKGTTKVESREQAISWADAWNTGAEEIDIFNSATGEVYYSLVDGEVVWDQWP